MNTTAILLAATTGSDLSPQPGEAVIEEICGFNWSGLSHEELIDVAWAYYYFSIQFRENLETACALMPDDALLQELDRGERNTDNLSPFPGVVATGERVNHDEFMRRTLLLAPIGEERRRRLEAIGANYLNKVRNVGDWTKALSLASYEDGGLERLFKSILTAPHWKGPMLAAFRHFLEKHIEFDSDVENGHGGLCRHLPPDQAVADLWVAYRDSLLAAVPGLR